MTPELLTSARVWVVGSLNQDLHLDVERHPRTGETVLAGDLERRHGGKGANQAVAAALAARSAGSSAQVIMVGAVGSDAAGSDYRSRLEAFGVDASRVATVKGVSTGTAIICVDGSGDNMIMVSPGANNHVTADHVRDALADTRAGDVVVLQLEIPLDAVTEAIRVAADRGARVVVNLAPYADLDPEVLARCDPVVVNEHEHDHLQRAGLACPSLLVTLGTEGSRWGELAVEAAPVDPVDTTGAGDSYVGTLAAALASGADRHDAMRTAARAAAECVGHEGAQPEPPDVVG